MKEVQVLFEGDYEYDGMGRLLIERIWQYDKTAKRMLITRETRTTFDLMGNPTEIKYYDVDGFAFTEQRTYARGGQLTGFTIPSTAADVTVNTAGSYSYNTNNDMTGTKKLDAYRTISGTNYKIVFRAQWTFAFDRKNRLKTHTYPSGLNVRGNIWYDGIGRVWQRWNDDSVTGDWDADLKRFVYDGNALAQEHKFTASGNGSWTYSYGRCDIDYLRKPDGIRQKVNNGVGGWDEHFLFNDGADVASRAPSGSSTTITRTLRTASGDRLNDNPRMSAGLGSGSFSNISNLAKPNSYIESYGGGTELGTSSLGFDALVQSGPVHQLPALGGMLLGSPPAGSVGGLGADWSVSGGAATAAQRPGLVGKGGGSGDPSECLPCCYEYYAPHCFEKFDRRRCPACWMNMCCCPGTRVDIMGAGPCAYEKWAGFLPEDYDCKEKCCTTDEFDRATETEDCDWQGTSCGGSGGGCWPASDLGDLIRDLCENLNKSGCLSYCPGQGKLCACMRSLCECWPFRPYIILDPWGYTGGPITIWGFPPTIILPAPARWQHLLHEMVHACMFMWGLVNPEATAYACERVCEGQYYVFKFTDPGDPGYEYKDVDPCCCSADPPFHCATFGEEVGHGFQTVIRLGIGGASPLPDPW